MANNKIYKVLFKGKILPGFDKETVIDNVYNITRIPKETIKRKFFSGKTVVIRRADSQEYASRLQKIFGQAGIETYVDEVVETFINDEENESQTLEPSEWETHQADHDTEQPSDSQAKPVIKKLAFIGIAAIVLITVIGYFLLDTPESVHRQPTDAEIAELKKQDTLPDNKIFSSPRQINGLIKVTDRVELSRLIRFLPLFDINPEYLQAFEKFKDFSNSISSNNPLYIFVTKQHKVIYFNTNTEIDKITLKQLQNQLHKIQTNTQGKQRCAKTEAFNLYQAKQTILLSSIQPEQVENNKHEILIKNISDSVKELDTLFLRTKESADATFDFYYHIPEPSGATVASPDKQLPNSNFLSLSVRNNTFWLTPGRQLEHANTELLKHLGVKIKQSQAITSMPGENLFDLALLLISQSQPGIFSGNQSISSFAQEKIIDINPSFAEKKIKAYEKNLDIEFEPQWQSGPFAIVTNNYQFNKQLKIELLAKGQNIDNLMEYSQSAKLIVHSAYNNKKENIITHECKPSSESYFKDFDGEQEAYIDDDFVTYHATTAIKKIRIKPGNHIEDVEQIAGEIKLNLPDKILHKTIVKPTQINVSHFEHFTLVTNMANKNTIDYQLIGNPDNFLTLRAYNQAGDILETTLLKEHAQNNALIHHYQQSYSEPIHSIRIFHTRKNESIIYPFTLKPEILASSRPLLTNDAEPLSFDNSAIELDELNENILTDNPPWLGKKIAEIKLRPFYISLFLYQGSQDELMPGNNTLVSKNVQLKSTHKDAVINIKTAITPLISQNMTAVKVVLREGSDTLLNDFLPFNEKEFFSSESIDETLRPELYLNSNSAFQIPTQKNEIRGLLSLSLPTAFKNHTSKFLSPGQIIKLGDILVKPIKITRQQVYFEINGNIDNLVQVKLYNSQNKLISETHELKQVQKDKAQLTLLYNDKIETIKVILAHSTSKKDYPFSFSVPLQE